MQNSAYLRHSAPGFPTAAVISTFRGSNMKNNLPLVVTIVFSIVGVVGDYLLKLASEQRSPLSSRFAHFEEG